MKRGSEMTKLKKGFTKLFLIGILLIVTFSQTKEQLFVTATDFDTLNIDDFSDFTIRNNHSAISSIKRNETVSFAYDGLSSNSGVHENYLMTFNESGNCYDFEYTTRFNYSLTDVDDRITFRMMMGSYYTHDGYIIGLPEQPGNEDFLFSAGLTDIWSTDIGYHVMYLYPSDVKLKLQGVYGSIGYSGDLEIYATRINTTLSCILRDAVTKEIYLEQVLTDGVTKPINYLYMDFYTGDTDSNVDVCAYYINVNLKIPSDLTTIIFGFPTLALISSIFSFLVIPVFIKKKK